MYGATIVYMKLRVPFYKAVKSNETCKDMREMMEEERTRRKSTVTSPSIHDKNKYE
jgi:hypothetical protein